MSHFHHTSENQQRYQMAKRVTWVSALTNLLLGVIKIFFGAIGHSSALVADGIHSLADLLCDGLVLVASYFSQHDPDEEHPYGHRRFETAATFILGVILIATAFVVAYEAIARILQHQISMPDQFTLIVAVISLVVNEWLFRYTLKSAKKIESALLEANAWHSRADALSSLVVMIGLLGALAGWFFLDDVAAVVVAVFIAKIGVDWGWKAFCEITDKGLEKQDLQTIKKTILSVSGVLRMHQLRTRTMAGQIFLDVHILVEATLTASEGHYIAECVRFALSKQVESLADVTVHVDVEEHKETLPTKLLSSRQQILDRLMPYWQQFIDPSAIIRIDLYYSSNSIKMQVLINLQSVTGAHQQAITQRFCATAQHVMALTDIAVFFRV